MVNIEALSAEPFLKAGDVGLRPVSRIRTDIVLGTGG